MNTLSSTTIKIPQKALKKGVVLLDLEEFYQLQKRAAPTYYFTGKKAEEVDILVKEGLKAHREGKAIKAGSIRSALKTYEQREKRRS